MFSRVITKPRSGVLKTTDYDLAIIGWGAAGFAAAIKASELTSGQMHIALIGNGQLGGTCVNVGCVPSKLMIEASKTYYEANHKKYDGISGNASLDFGKFMESLNKFVETERKGKYTEVIENFKNVELIEGEASFTGENTVHVNGKEIKATNFLIATGSKTFVPDISGLDDYYTSDTIWNARELPKKIAIFGSGEVAMEFAYALSNFGSEVHVFNRHNRVLKGFDDDITGELMKAMRENGVVFHLGVNYHEIKTVEGKKDIYTWTGTFTGFDAILISTGRMPNIAKLNLHAACISTENGIVTDKHLRTTNKRVYAAGDCVRQSLQLETLAGKEGVIAVENILGGEKTINLNEVPWVVFTEPNVASVGQTEKELITAKKDFTVRVISIKNVVKANILHSYNGVAKILAGKDGKILGVQVIAPNAAEFITEAVQLVKHGLTYEDLIDTVHVFPTVAESIKIAGQAFIRDVSKMSCCMD